MKTTKILGVRFSIWQTGVQNSLDPENVRFSILSFSNLICKVLILANRNTELFRARKGRLHLPGGKMIWILWELGLCVIARGLLFLWYIVHIWTYNIYDLEAAEATFLRFHVL